MKTKAGEDPSVEAYETARKRRGMCASDIRWVDEKLKQGLSLERIGGTYSLRIRGGVIVRNIKIHRFAEDDGSRTKEIYLNIQRFMDGLTELSKSHSIITVSPEVAIASEYHRQYFLGGAETLEINDDYMVLKRPERLPCTVVYHLVYPYKLT